jgi:hypothetical protein
MVHTKLTSTASKRMMIVPKTALTQGKGSTAAATALTVRIEGPSQSKRAVEVGLNGGNIELPFLRRNVDTDACGRLSVGMDGQREGSLRQ